MSTWLCKIQLRENQNVVNNQYSLAHPRRYHVKVLESGGGTGSAQRLEHISEVTASDLKITAHLHVVQAVSIAEI